MTVNMTMLTGREFPNNTTQVGSTTSTCITTDGVYNTMDMYLFLLGFPKYYRKYHFEGGKYKQR